jgi:hypothetical protein
MNRWLSHTDRIAGRIYHRVLAVVFGTAALIVLASGLFMMRAGAGAFVVAWLAGGLGFGLLARWLWRSRATLSDTFDGHG